MAGAEPSPKPAYKVPKVAQALASKPPLSAAESRATLARMVEVIERDARYAVDAYRFLQEGLEFTVRRAHGAESAEVVVEPGKPDPRHVTGRDLCLGLRDLALARWGKLARTVLNHWGIFATRDFGQMVFVLVENEFLMKTDSDRIEDFEDVYCISDLEALYEVPPGPLHADEQEYVAAGAQPAGGGQA